MCEHGDTVLMSVPIQDFILYQEDKVFQVSTYHWKVKPVDRCLAGLIRRLNGARLLTAGCCCGHGKGPADILFHNGHELTVDECEALLLAKQESEGT